MSRSPKGLIFVGQLFSVCLVQATVLVSPLVGQDEFTPPNPSEFRAELSNGLVVYIAEDHQAPWFNAELLFPSNPYLEPEGKVGVAALTETLIREGGSRSRSRTEVDREMAVLAGSVSSRSLSLPVRFAERGLDLWFDLISDPGFPEESFRYAKDEAIEAASNSKARPGLLANFTFDQLVYGVGSRPTVGRGGRDLLGITREDVITWHTGFWVASNAVLVVYGAFEREGMLRTLESTFGKWGMGVKAAPAPFGVFGGPSPGVYVLEPQTAPSQGMIRIGHLGITSDNPDYPAVEILGQVLGAGFLSSRIPRVVRGEYGLAYSVGAYFLGGDFFPGIFVAKCQTKNSTVVFASQLILREILKIRTEPITPAELALAKRSRKQLLRSIFSGPSSTVRAFANLEADGLPLGFYEGWDERYEGVTVDDVFLAARRYLRPEELVILIVGDHGALRYGAGDDEPNQESIERVAHQFGGRTLADLARAFGDGEVHVLPTSSSGQDLRH